MANAVYPVPLGDELASSVRQAARETGLSQAEVMRQAIGFGLDSVRRVMHEEPGRLTSVEPLPEREAQALYELDDDDRMQIDQLMAVQRLEVAE